MTEVEDWSQNEENWVDGGDLSPLPSSISDSPPAITAVRAQTLVMVETAFLASTASLIWLLNYYFPLGPLFKIFFPLPIALIFMRWHQRAAWMGTVVAGLLLTILMGPTRSIIYIVPYGLMGVQVGAIWKRQGSWGWSLGFATLLGTFGFFFRFWLLSLLVGEDFWLYALTQIMGLAEWILARLGILAEPSLWFVQGLAVAMIVLNSAIYAFVIHLVALLMFDRLGNPIPRPPQWVQTLIEYDY